MSDIPKDIQTIARSLAVAIINSAEFYYAERQIANALVAERERGRKRGALMDAGYSLREAEEIAFKVPE